MTLGVRVGMPASKAQAMVADLLMVDAAPAEDGAALERLALWALRQYSPVVAVDGTDGLVIDTEGADHLQGGEDLLISGLVNRLRGHGLTARAAVSDTWGASHAIARLIPGQTTVVPVGNVAKAVVDLPILALRLAAETVQGLRVLGIDTVGQLSAMPRAPLKVFERQRRLVLTASMLAINGKIPREGDVVHLVAQQLFDLSEDLDQLGERDEQFPLPHGRGDEFAHGNGAPDPRARPKAVTPASNSLMPDLLIDRLKVKSRNFH